MAKGHYKGIFGGSKSGYQKGVKDTLIVVGIAISSIATGILAILNSKKKN